MSSSLTAAHVPAQQDLAPHQEALVLALAGGIHDGTDSALNIVSPLTLHFHLHDNLPPLLLIRVSSLIGEPESLTIHVLDSYPFVAPTFLIWVWCLPTGVAEKIRLRMHVSRSPSSTKIPFRVLEAFRYQQVLC